MCPERAPGLISTVQKLDKFSRFQLCCATGRDPAGFDSQIAAPQLSGTRKAGKCFDALCAARRDGRAFGRVHRLGPTLQVLMAVFGHPAPNSTGNNKWQWKWSSNGYVYNGKMIGRSPHQPFSFAKGFQTNPCTHLTCVTSLSDLLMMLRRQSRKAFRFLRFHRDGARIPSKRCSRIDNMSTEIRFVFFHQQLF